MRRQQVSFVIRLTPNGTFLAQLVSEPRRGAGRQSSAPPPTIRADTLRDLIAGLHEIVGDDYLTAQGEEPLIRILSFQIVREVARA